jgi:hypothetical protein
VANRVGQLGDLLGGTAGHLARAPHRLGLECLYPLRQHSISQIEEAGLADLEFGAGFRHALLACKVGQDHLRANLRLG